MIEESIVVDMDLEKLPKNLSLEREMKYHGKDFIIHRDKLGLYVGRMRGYSCMPYGSFEKSVVALCELGIDFKIAKDVIRGNKRLIENDEGVVLAIDDNWVAPDISDKVEEAKKFMQMIIDYEVSPITHDIIQIKIMKYIAINVNYELDVNPPLGICSYDGYRSMMEKIVLRSDENE